MKAPKKGKMSGKMDPAMRMKSGEPSMFGMKGGKMKMGGKMGSKMSMKKKK